MKPLVTSFCLGLCIKRAQRMIIFTALANRDVGLSDIAFARKDFRLSGKSTLRSNMESNADRRVAVPGYFAS